MAIGRSQVVRWSLWVAAISCLAMGCGPAPTPEPTPLQFPLQSPIDPTPTRAPADTPTATPVVSPTPLPDQPTPEPTPTPDMIATSASVIATLTAQAATPTFPPTATPRRRPVGSGAGEATRAPTRTPGAGGIALIALSERVYAGSAGTLTIRTQPRATCTVQIARPDAGGRRVTAIDGATRQAGDDGVIAWIWAVAADEPAGPAALLVACAGVGAAEYAIEIVR